MRGNIRRLEQCSMVRDRLTSLSYDIVGSSPEQFKVVYEADLARFARIVRDAKIPLQD